MTDRSAGKITGAIDRLWYPSADQPAGFLLGLLSLLLRPLSALFGLIASCRRRRLASLAVPCQKPTVIVGNLAVGGAGKTPLVIELIRQLDSAGLHPGVVSRGYGSSAEQSPAPISVAEHPDTAAVGDEPLLIHQRSQVPVFVHPDRAAARAALLQSGNCDIVISDDGLQHYRLSRTLEIVVIDAARGLGNGRLLPAGPLREPASRLLEADMIVLNYSSGSQRCAEDMADALTRLPGIANSVHGKLSAAQISDLAARCWPMMLEPGALLPLYPNPDATSEAPVAGDTVSAVAGIGNPQRFFDTLATLGFTVMPHAFKDHHDFGSHELDALQGHVVMTEKDAVKCRQLRPVKPERFWYLPIRARLPESFHAVLLAGVAIKPCNAAE